MIETLGRIIGGLAAPSAGLLFALTWVISGYIVLLAARHLEHRATPRALKVRFWSGWPFLGRLVAAGASMFWLLALLRLGVFVSSDAGLGHVAPASLWRNGQRLGSWLTLTAGSGGLMLVLWLSYWRREPRRLLGAEKGLSPLSFVLVTIAHQSALAILRAAATPLVGLYWAIWIAAAVKLILMLAHPLVRHRLAHGDRSFVYLEWALDWQSAALFALYGNLLMTILARLLVGGLLRVIRGRMVRRRADATAVGPPSAYSGEH